jgi:hypothetical protein
MENKKLQIISVWEGKLAFKGLQSLVKKYFNDGYSVDYLFYLENHKKSEDIPVRKDVNHFTKKDFSFFGKFKNTAITTIINQPADKKQIITVEPSSKWIKKLIKHSQLVNFGMESEELITFDIAFLDATVTTEKLFQHVNKYIIKIQ